MSARHALVAAGLAAALFALTATPSPTARPDPTAVAARGPAELPTTAADGSYGLPVGEGVVLRLYAAPSTVWGRGHRGVDLSAGPGDLVRAPAAGVVAFAGTVVDRDVLTINHPDGLRSSLEPVVPSVDVGQPVGAGDTVGSVQDVVTHCRPDACLHWGVRRGEVYLDPLDLLAGAGPVVLLPVSAP
ncbi:murein hydrolase activator EnvC [Cellulomonas sp. KRMCY2]|uniref:murein hydrolase activator EnvC family protein n=1 Tax=Cellulomonas sp. KRMCY2 TaxID=1304865 RepID=UPI00045EB581|nr:M23 family metallopeptidase [Cellulomonas sp. KRMCY2]